MAQTTINVTGEKGFPTTAAAIKQFARVKLNSSGQVLESAGANDAIGVAMAPVPAAGVPAVTVQLFSAAGSIYFIASAAIAVAAVLYPAAAGKVGVAVVGNPLGYVALTAATADLDVIEACPIL